MDFSFRQSTADRAENGRLHHRLLSENQLDFLNLDFLNLVIDHLTQCGWMRPEQLYSSPFTDEFVEGPNTVFQEESTLRDLIDVLATVRENAVGLERSSESGVY